jgi:kanamycin kinase
MADAEFAYLANQHALGDDPIPDMVLEFGEGADLELVWRNELGGLTFRAGERFIKWNPRDSGEDLDRERFRLVWLEGRHPVPTVLDHGGDDRAQWLVTAAMGGEHAVGDRWRARRSEAIAAIATGLRALHAVPVDDFPEEWVDSAWPNRRGKGPVPRPAIGVPVLVHGDACAPNTLIDDDGDWVGNVDFGDLTVGDRWADLAIASISLDWNFGEGHQREFFDAYGIEPDADRIAYYRGRWDIAS